MQLAGLVGHAGLEHGALDTKVLGPFGDVRHVVRCSSGAGVRCDEKLEYAREVPGIWLRVLTSEMRGMESSLI